MSGVERARAERDSCLLFVRSGSACGFLDGAVFDQGLASGRTWNGSDSSVVDSWRLPWLVLALAESMRVEWAPITNKVAACCIPIAECGPCITARHDSSIVCGPSRPGEPD